MALSKLGVSGLNIDQLKAYLGRMTPQQRQQVAAQYKNSPYASIVIPLAMGITQDEQKMSKGLQAQQQAGQEQPKVVDEVLSQMSPQGQGIAQLPAQNIAQMADGGIAGYDDYDMGVGYAEGGQVERYQDRGAVRNPLGDYEALVREEAQRQGVDPDLAVRLFIAESGGNPRAVSPKGAVGLGQLMPAAAQEMGLDPKERTDPLKNIRASLGYFAKQQQKYGDPALAAAAYNWGPGNLDRHLSRNQGQLNTVGLPKETADYLTKLLPVAPAQATPAAPPADLSAQIPGQNVKAPAAQVEEPGFFKRQAERLGLSPETQRNLANLNTALSGAMGATYIPSYLPKGEGALDAVKRGGEALYNKMFPAPGLSQAQIKAMQAANAAEAPGRAAEAARLAGALPGEAETAAAAVRTAQAANIPSAAERIQSASVAREAAEAARLGQAGRAAQTFPKAAAASQLPDVPAGETPFIPTPGDDSYDRAEKNKFIRQAMERLETDVSKKDLVQAAKAAAPEEGKKGWKGEDWLLLGLGLMASKNQRFLGALGEAGLGVVKERREQAKEEATEAYRRALTREAEAKAKVYESGTGEAAKATAYADKAFDNWLNGVKANPMLQMNITPEQIEAKRMQYLREAYAMFKIPMPAGVAGGANQGWTVTQRPS